MLEPGLPVHSPADKLKSSLARAARMILVVAIALKLGFLIAYAVRMQWVMDEFAQGFTGRLVTRGLYSTIDPIKTVLPQLVMWLAVEWSDTAQSALLALRLETLGAALVIVLATALAGQRMYRDLDATLLCAFVLLCFSNFLEHAFRVRNDSFAVMFTTLAMLSALDLERERRAAYVSGVLACAAFLCTQKSIYQVVGISSIHVGLGWHQAKGAGASRRMLRYAAAFAAVLALYAVGFGGTAAGEVLASVFLSPFRHRQELMTNDLYPDIGHFIVQTLTRNWLVYALCALGLAACARKELRQRPLLAAAAPCTLFVTALVFLHPQPWPYVFVMCLPMLALFAPAWMQLVPHSRRAAASLGVVAALAFSFDRNVDALLQDNVAQLHVVAQVESMLGLEDRYFDGIGMVPTREIAGAYPTWYWDAGRLATLRHELESGHSQTLAQILSDGPKVWILNYRFYGLKDHLEAIWARSTVAVSPNILVSGRWLGAESRVPFHNLWEGPYRALSEQGNPLADALVVDGSPCAAPCRISVGPHVVYATDSRATYLVPTDVTPLDSRASGAAPINLFAMVYDF